MNFEFTEEQKLLKDSVRKFLDKEIFPIVNERDRKGALTKEEVIGFIKKLKPFGYYSGFFPPEYGGEGMDAISTGILGEELSRVWAGMGGAVGIAALAAVVIVAPEEVRERLVPRLKEGELIGCIAITEPDVGSDARAIKTKAISDGDYYVINGNKIWVTNGTIADVCLLVAKDETGTQQMIIVDRETSPFRSSEIHKLGMHACPTAELFFEDCRVPKENNLMTSITRMLSGGQVPELVSGGQMPQQFLSSLVEIGPLNMIFAFIRSGIALQAVGISQAALDASIKYAKERVQFGKPIGKFQLIQNMIYEMVAQTEASRLLGYYALDLASRGGKEVRKVSSVAKAYATEAAIRTTSMAIEIHGAMGLSEDLPLERYFRDARMLTMPDGTTEIQKLIVGREVLGMSAYV